MGWGRVYFPTPVSDVILLFGVDLGVTLNGEEDESTQSTEIVSVQLVGSVGHTAHPALKGRTLVLPFYFFLLPFSSFN